jgi:hypothetical protein
MLKASLRRICVIGVSVVAAAAGAGAIAAAVGAFESPPIVVTASPNAGPTTGGTEVTISGQQFGSSCGVSLPEPTCPNLIVYFGNQPGLVVSAEANTIRALSPPHPAGIVGITVVTPASGPSSFLGFGPVFTYSGSTPVQTPGTPPVVRAVEPGRGPQGGFNRVIIKGEHLTPRDAVCVQCSGDVVSFGTRQVAVAEGSQNELQVFAPPGFPGFVDVTVTTNPGGTSARSFADLYAYQLGF